MKVWFERGLGDGSSASFYSRGFDVSVYSYDSPLN